MGEQSDLVEGSETLQEQKEEIISEDQPREEVEATEVVDGNVANSIDFADFKKLVDEHFLANKGLVRYSKEKDANVLALSKQIQTYRDGFEATLFKRIALDLISYREDCRKSIREFESMHLSVDDVRKYLRFLQQDFEDLLQNLGVADKDGQYLYNGKSLTGGVETFAFSEVPEIEDIQLNNEELHDTAQAVNYLKECENAIAKMIKNNAILDSVIADYIRVAATYEQGLYQIVLYPVIRRIVRLYEGLRDRIQAKTDLLTDENANTAYILELNYVAEQCEQLLSLCNVTIDSFVADSYDPKKHRILKMIATDDTDINGTVAFRYTDCYMMDDKVIYPSKIDIYKTR